MNVWLPRVSGFILLCVVSVMANAVQTQTIKKETERYILDIQYPQGLSSRKIDSSLRQKIDHIKNEFIQSLGDEDDLPQDTPGKSGLTITYSLPYQRDSLLSVKLMVSGYHRGAAHPENWIETMNFMNNERIDLSALFRKNSDYLKAFANYSRKRLLAGKDDFDREWVLKGTEPKADNYSKWYFRKDGIAVIFDTYQVAAYVYGPQTLIIPLSTYRTMLKPEVLNIVWGS